MMIPTVHLNGTSGLDLIKQHLDAIRALHHAYDAMAAAAPNGRDYYPQGPDAYSKAFAEHDSRMQRIRDVIMELSQIREALQ